MEREKNPQLLAFVIFATSLVAALPTYLSRWFGPGCGFSFATSHIVIVSVFTFPELWQSCQSPKKKQKKTCEHSPRESTQGFISPLPNHSIFQRAPVPRILVKASFSHLVYSVVLFLSVKKKEMKSLLWEKRCVLIGRLVNRWQGINKKIQTPWTLRVAVINIHLSI